MTDAMQRTDGQERGPAVIVIGASRRALARKAQEALARDGHEVTGFDTPEALLAEIDLARTDLILLAFDGMNSDGFALCREIRSRSEGHPISILVAGQGDDAAVMARVREAGADEWLPRPIHAPLLRRLVSVLLHSGHRLFAMRERLARMEDAQRIGQVGSWVLDTDTRDMLWSAETYRILGLKPGVEKANLDLFAMFIQVKEHAAVMQQILEAAESAECLELSYSVMLPSGDQRQVQLRGEPLSQERAPKLHGTIHDVTEQRQSQEEIRRLAHYDSLTGLANRRRFTEQLNRLTERARFSGSCMALLYMDLDQFKRINDTLGHSAGDHLLEHVADVLFETVRPTDLIARNVDEDADVEVSRLGGDEFAILLSEVSCPEAASRAAERILEAVTAPTSFEEHQISTTASIGIAIYPDDGEDVEALIKHADIAMYKAKERGRNTYEFYSHEMNEGTLRKLTMENHLRHALEHDELRLVYQPRVNLRERKIAGLEALLRWDSAALGTVMPKDFIPLAEETGLIVPIGAWVLETACAQAEAWRAAGFPKVCVSVNVSSRQFVHNDLRETVVNALKISGLDPDQLELEITESVLLEDDRNTSEMLHHVKAMGVHLALDDFGTGYSSMGYLTRLPLDTLKLDLSLVRNVGADPTARGIATALIAMAHAVDLSVTAEGVDQIDQATFLEQEGCDELQGFLISGPVAPEECERMFTEPERVLASLGWYPQPAQPTKAPPRPLEPESDTDENDLPALKPVRRSTRRRATRPE